MQLDEIRVINPLDRIASDGDESAEVSPRDVSTEAASMSTEVIDVDLSGSASFRWVFV